MRGSLRELSLKHGAGEGQALGSSPPSACTRPMDRDTIEWATTTHELRPRIRLSLTGHEGGASRTVQFIMHDRDVQTLLGAIDRWRASRGLVPLHRLEPGDVAGDDVAQVVAALAERVAVLEAQVAQILARLPDVKPWQRPR